MQFGRSYDANNAEIKEFTPIPKGSYTVQIEDIKERNSATSDWEGLAVKLRVMDGQYKNRVVFDSVTVLSSVYPDSVQKGIARMSAYAKACGVQQLTHSEQIIGKIIDVYVGIRENKQGADENAVYGVSALKTPQQQANLGFQPSQPMQTGAYGNSNVPGVYGNNQQVMQPNFPQQQPIATNANVAMQGNTGMYNNGPMPQMSGSILQGCMPRPNSTVGSNQQNEDIPF